MMTKRSYRQNCALARAADLIGERWTVLLIRDLLVAPRRFRDLLASAKGIGTNLLAARLKHLEGCGIIEKRPLDSKAHGYALTARGKALEPAVLALIRWGLLHGPENREGDHHQHDWDLLALKSLFQEQRAGKLRLGVQFDSEEFRGWMRLQGGRIDIGTGELDGADLVVGGTVEHLFVASPEPEKLLKSGSADLLRQFMAAFALRP